MNVFIFLVFISILPLFSATGSVNSLKNRHISIFYSRQNTHFGMDIVEHNKKSEFIFHKDGNYSSYLTILRNKELYVFGAKPGKLLKNSLENGVITSVWQQSNIRIVRRIALAPRAYYSVLSYKILNTGKKTQKLGIRLLLDTEFESHPFYLDNGVQVDTETKIYSDEFYRSIYMLQGDVIGQVTFIQSKPTYIVFSNWLKAFCNAGDFIVLPGKSYRYKDILYSDAAISVYWKDFSIAAGQAKTISLRIGGSNFVEKANRYMETFFNIAEPAGKKKILATAFLLNKTDTALGPTIISFDFDRDKRIGIKNNAEKIFFTEVPSKVPIFLVWNYDARRFGYYLYNFSAKSMVNGENLTLSARDKYNFVPQYYSKIIANNGYAAAKIKQVKELSKGFPSYSSLQDLTMQSYDIIRNLKDEKFKKAYILSRNAYSFADILYRKALKRKKRYRRLLNAAKRYKKGRNIDALKTVYNKLLNIKGGNDKHLLKMLLVINKMIQIRDLYKAANDFMLYNSYNQARDIYRSIAQLDPKEKKAYYNIGVIFLKENSFDSAAKYFDRVIRIDSKFSLAFYQLAVIAVYKGNKDSAKDYLLKALAIAPQFARARELLKSLK